MAGLNLLDQLLEERAEKAAEERESITPEERRAEAQGLALDPPFPFAVVTFPILLLDYEG